MGTCGREIVGRQFQSRASAIAEHEAEMTAKAAEEAEKQTNEDSEKTTTSWRASSSAGASATPSPAMASAKVFRDAFAEEEAAEAQKASMDNSPKKRLHDQVSDRIRVAPGELQHILGHDTPAHTTSHLTVTLSTRSESTGAETATTEEPDRTTAGIDVLVTPELIASESTPESATESATPRTPQNAAAKKAAEAYRSDSPKYHSHKD